MVYKPNNLTYNLYLDQPIDYSKLADIKILVIKENLPLTTTIIKYITDNQIKFIEFSSIFNYPIDSLPICVEHIFFPSNSKFNYPMDNLPTNLKTLIIGNGYWHSLGQLPVSLRYLGYHKSILEFDKHFNSTNSGNSPIVCIEDILESIPPNMIYFSIASELKERINIPNIIYGGKIIKVSEYCSSSFIDLIMERHNQDYFSASMNSAITQMGMG
jgi:hypothetical protein